MSADPALALLLDVVSLPFLTNLLVLCGLVLAAVNGFRAVTEREPARIATSPLPAEGTVFARAVWRGPALILAPPAVVWIGFFLSLSASTVWLTVVGAAGAGLAVAALALLRAQYRLLDRPWVPGPAVAVLVATAALVMFGLLLAVRIVVVRDPAAGFLDAFETTSVGRGAGAVVVPLAGFAGLLALCWVAQQPWYRRPTVLRPRTWRSARLRQAGRSAAVLAVLALFALPLVGGSAGNLTFAGLATTEYGKIVYLLVLVAVLVRYAPGLGRGGGPDGSGLHFAHRVRVHVLGRRHIYGPLLLFALVAVPSVVRRDLGPLIPVACATTAVLWRALVAEVGLRAAARRGAGAGHARLEALKSARWGIGSVAAVGAMLVAVGRLMKPDRFIAWGDPWRYRWDAVCVPPPPGIRVPDVPPGTDACLRSVLAEQDGARAQVSQGIAATADGGLWGRGLVDSATARVPAGSTDFVLTVIWGKLGALTVLAVTLLVAVLVLALPRLPGNRRTGGPSSHQELFAVGLAAMLGGQFLFVLAATTGFLPQSGITAPFLSRGGQSTLALSAALVVAVAGGAGATLARSASAKPVAARNAGGSVPPPRSTRLRDVVRSPALVVAVLGLLVVTWTTVRPYGGHDAHRPACTGSAPVDPAACSTDRFAYLRTVTAVRMGGEIAFVRSRTDPGWRPVPGAPLPLTDMAGLLQVGDLSAGGLDLGVPEVQNAVAGTALTDRLRPPHRAGSPDAVVDLTVDPPLQHAAADALNSDTSDLPGPLPGGVVVLAADTGRVLAAATAPGGVETPSRPAVAGGPLADLDALLEFGRAHPPGLLRDGGVDPAPGCVEDDPAGCWRWLYRASPPAPAVEADDANRRRFDPRGVVPPPSDVDRALGKRYGLGSTFKVVVAAAYLGLPGTSPTDEIPAPVVLPLGGRTEIRNFGGGACPGGESGSITLTRAMAVSCNTAFVALARDQVGWERIRDTAAALGFTVGPLDDIDPAGLAGLDIGVDSRVPAAVDRVEIGNAALGGGDVAGTPLQMATVLATVANGGRWVQPVLVSAVTSPDAQRVRTPAGATRTVLTTDQATELKATLADTTTVGTARGLAVPGHDLFVKTGTHEIDRTPVRQISWMTGFVETSRGPVAFAAALETTDEAAGSRRVRTVAQRVLDAVVEAGG